MDILKKTEYFSALSEPELDFVRARVVEKRVKRGELLFLEGEPCAGLHLIVSGRVRVFKTSAEGKEQVLALMQAGQSFNEVPLLDGGLNPATAEALEDTHVYVLSKESMAQIICAQPSVALAMLRIFAARLRHLSVLVEELSFKHVTSRLAKILLEQARQSSAEHGEAHAPHRVTQQELAAMVGTAREVVARALKNLEKQGVIKVARQRIVIVNPKELERLI
ncbi:MAG: Crp/Fnr family transcriptional regulator [Chloroflexota bacterium]|nr:MAG: Crp/Fnr family transcriptional regulator [Chloroflexota bacterium]